MQLGYYIWKSMYRNCGELSVTRITDGQHQVVIKNLPQCVVECRPYLLGTGVAFVCLFALGNIKAKVTLEQPPNTKDAVYQITWDVDQKV